MFWRNLWVTEIINPVVNYTDFNLEFQTHLEPAQLKTLVWECEIER